MNIENLCSYANRNYIISEHLRNVELYGYMDIVIDDINERLQACFPIISEWKEYATKYNEEHGQDEDFVALDANVYSAFPARYLRSVVALGAASNFFTNDEEGEQIASKYYIQYERNIANMLRDYHLLVPEIYQNNEGGYITNDYNARDDKEASIEGIVMEHGYIDIL